MLSYLAERDVSVANLVGILPGLLGPVLWCMLMHQPYLGYFPKALGQTLKKRWQNAGSSKHCIDWGVDLSLHQPALGLIVIASSFHGSGARPYDASERCRGGPPVGRRT